LLTEAIKKQMTILGPEITLLKVRNVGGLTLAEDGTVTAIAGNLGEIITRFLEQFRELSSPLVKKTMQPLLSTINATPLPISPVVASQPVISPNKV
jgi:hypothetical protein